MSLAQTLFYDDIQYSSNYGVYMEARLGGNGDENGMPEVVLGDGNDATYSRQAWDTDLSDGFDSGYHTTALNFTLSGAENSASATPDVDSSPLTYSASAAGTIDKVELRAYSLAAGNVEWGNVEIQFYRGDELVDSYSTFNGPAVDTNSSTSSNIEAILTVTPEASDCDRVVISGAFRMSYDSTTQSPGGTDMAGQIFVYQNTL